MQRNETRSPTYTIHQNKHKMDKRHKYTHKKQYHKSPSEKISSKISDIPCSNIFVNICPKAREIKERIKNGDYIK